jgi:hypothetical protein
MFEIFEKKCIVYMKIVCYFIQETGASMDFGIQGRPGPNLLWIPRDNSLLITWIETKNDPIKNNFMLLSPISVRYTHSSVCDPGFWQLEVQYNYVHTIVRRPLSVELQYNHPSLIAFSREQILRQWCLWHTWHARKICKIGKRGFNKK